MIARPNRRMVKIAVPTPIPALAPVEKPDDVAPADGEEVLAFRADVKVVFAADEEVELVEVSESSNMSGIGVAPGGISELCHSTKTPIPKLATAWNKSPVEAAVKVVVPSTIEDPLLNRPVKVKGRPPLEVHPPHGQELVMRLDQG
jgi:hypothetical protein